MLPDMRPPPNSGLQPRRPVQGPISFLSTQFIWRAGELRPDLLYGEPGQLLVGLNTCHTWWHLGAKRSAR